MDAPGHVLLHGLFVDFVFQFYIHTCAEKTRVPRKIRKREFPSLSAGENENKFSECFNVLCSFNNCLPCGVSFLLCVYDKGGLDPSVDCGPTECWFFALYCRDLDLLARFLGWMDNGCCYSTSGLLPFRLLP